MNFDDLDKYLENNKVDDMQIERLLSLLQTSTLNEVEFIELRNEIEEFKMFYDRYNELYFYLTNNQIDPIKQGNISSMAQITNRINQIIQ